MLTLFLCILIIHRKNEKKSQIFEQIWLMQSERHFHFHPRQMLSLYSSRCLYDIIGRKPNATCCAHVSIVNMMKAANARFCPLNKPISNCFGNDDCFSMAKHGYGFRLRIIETMAIV